MSNTRKKDIVILLILSFIVIGAMYLFFSLVLSKDMAKLEELKNRYQLQKTVASYLQENQKDLQEEIENSKDLLQFAQAKNIDAMLDKFLSKYFLSHTLKLISQHTHEGVVQKSFYAEVTMQSPQEFYTFVEDAQHKHIPLEINYPLVFEKTAQGIKLSFFIKVYQIE
ncbi:hypothetical protein [Nitratiruptor tergarcus]|uniref:Tfp pilus assembly protein PilN n=1 Tax=Nitratiruptor tergarcus DSM 16512 TaxID=1069081 RepID=A0A1W1WPX1_9BACT|nr:hypothetical protein [Nitratiruptor tergarcus]SMC08286.1 hypothetical protein SAMN05660197_0033 [Nitratiruptor tergarcus DSM 16512]